VEKSTGGFSMFGRYRSPRGGSLLERGVWALSFAARRLAA